MPRSFRIRLAGWFAVLAGLALAGFATMAWWRMYTARFTALDREIREQVERELARPWPQEHWRQHEANMARAFGAKSIRQTLLLVQYAEGEAFRSAHWPVDLDGDALPWTQPKSARVRTEPPTDTPPFPPPLRAAATSPPPRPEGSPVARARPPPPPISYITLRRGDQSWRLGLAANAFGRLAVGVDLDVVDAEMVELRTAFLLATPVALGLITLAAWLVSGRALSPIRQLSATMVAITAKGLHQRVAVDQEDQEFRQLIQVFNSMLERLERSFLQASRFSADAAHELKTPLAILQGQLEQAITHSEAGSPAQARLAEILDEVQRLATISRKLLMLSLADAGRLRLHCLRVDVSEALTDLLEDAQILAPELIVSGAIAPGLAVEADAALLRQLLHNLLGNAIKYNQPHGWIRLSAAGESGWVTITMANASMGIPGEDRERIFERFSRADSAHGHQVEGAGLGLSLAREIARAHGGELRLAETAATEARFIVTLPAAITVG